MEPSFRWITTRPSGASLACELGKLDGLSLGPAWTARPAAKLPTHGGADDVDHGHAPDGRVTVAPAHHWPPRTLGADSAPKPGGLERQVPST